MKMSTMKQTAAALLAATSMLASAVAPVVAQEMKKEVGAGEGQVNILA